MSNAWYIRKFRSKPKTPRQTKALGYISTPVRHPCLFYTPSHTALVGCPATHAPRGPASRLVAWRRISRFALNPVETCRVCANDYSNRKKPAPRITESMRTAQWYAQTLLSLMLITKQLIESHSAAGHSRGSAACGVFFDRSWLNQT